MEFLFIILISNESDKINHFLHLYKQNKFSEAKAKFRQTNNRCKRVLEAAKLSYANKTREFITSQKLGSCDFWRIASKSAIPPLLNHLFPMHPFSTPVRYSDVIRG